MLETVSNIYVNKVKRHSNSIHIVLCLSAISLIGCIGIPAKKIWGGNEVLAKSSSSSSSSFEGHPLQARHKQNWGRGFILLLPQTAALPGSDAGTDVIKPASSFVIQNRQTACSMWCPMYGAHC